VRIVLRIPSSSNLKVRRRSLVSINDLRTSQLSRVAGSKRDFIPQSNDVERNPSRKHAVA
jgi:hypothetical protein